MNISPMMANQGLLKTKAKEDPGSEIIKEVPGNSGGMPRMMGGLMGGLMAPNNMQGMFMPPRPASLMGGMLGGQGLGALGNPNMMKCKHLMARTICVFVSYLQIFTLV